MWLQFRDLDTSLGSSKTMKIEEYKENKCYNAWKK